MAYAQPTGVPTINPALHNLQPFGSITGWQISGPTDLQAITVGPDNNLWFVDYYQNAVRSFSTTGVSGAFYTIPTGGAAPVGIAAGADGNLWFGESATGQVGQATVAGNLQEWNVEFCSDPSMPIGITQGPDGNIWVADAKGSKIERVRPNGSVTEFKVNGDPIFIAAGPDGNMWYTEFTGGKIGKMNTSGTVLGEYSYSGGLAGPKAITAGPDGNMWFTEDPADLPGWGVSPPHTTAYLYSITMAGVITQSGYTGWPEGNIQQLATGPDGNLWFTNNPGGGYTSSVTVWAPKTQTQTRFQLGNSAWGIVAGPDGNMWVTDQKGRGIIRIGTGM